MIGAIIGDIIGSTYEFDNAGRYDFDPFPPGSAFTDDTVLTIAIADAILCGRDYSENFEDAIRKAIWLGGDSDTLACITGGIAEAYYREITGEWIEKSRRILDDRLNEVVDLFRKAYVH